VTKIKPGQRWRSRERGIVLTVRKRTNRGRGKAWLVVTESGINHHIYEGRLKKLYYLEEGE
jgi:hypothetical protein